jgi:hypothetical protein
MYMENAPAQIRLTRNILNRANYLDFVDPKNGEKGWQTAENGKSCHPHKSK